MFTHVCIKPGCGTQYEDVDPDPYYCPTHKKERDEIAAQIDAQHRPSSRAGPSFDEKMNAMPKIPGTNIPMVN